MSDQVKREHEAEAARALCGMLDQVTFYERVLCVCLGSRGVDVWAADQAARRAVQLRRKAMEDGFSYVDNEHD